MGGARKWPEKEATAVKVAELVALFPGYMGGARKWPEKEATAVKVAELVALFSQHVGGAMKWDGEEATSMNWLSRLWYVLGRPPCKSTCIV